MDDWEIEEDENWDDTFDYPRYDNHEDDDTAPHRIKFGIIETEYVKRWQQCVRFGRWITADESRLAGWYHSVTTIGPDDKPIRTGARNSSFSCYNTRQATVL